MTTFATTKHIFDFNPIYRCAYGLCANWSSPSNSFGASITAPQNTLEVTICYEPQGHCFSLTPIYNANEKLYMYEGCNQAVYAPDDPAVIEIPNSNGGRGVPTVITLTITNSSTSNSPKATVKNIRVEWGLSSDIFFAPSCVSPGQLQNSEYPFRWN
jgi:hypothetical protein